MNERILTTRERSWVEVARQTLTDADAPGLKTVGGAEYMVGRLRASVRSLLAIIDQPGTDQDPETVGAGSTAHPSYAPVLTVEPAGPRCPAAHPTDRTSCPGPVAVTVLNRRSQGLDGCEHHAALLLSALDRGRVFALPGAPDGAAIRVFKAAAVGDSR